MQLGVPPESAGERLDAFLAQPLGSRSRAARLIEAGLVLVDGTPARKGHRVRGGEQVAVLETPQPAADASQPGEVASFEIAYEDDHLIVVDKPAGVVVHPARGHRALKASLQARTMRREYLALVEGRPPALTGTIEAPIGRDRRVRTRMSTDTDSPKPAITHFELERALRQATLLRVRLQTGRTHQIRVHLQAIGHPVCGDPEYGTAGLYGLRRQFLHAARLAFPHPAGREPVDVSSPLPADLVAALAAAK